ncbi:glycosyltransferase, partial [Candidatus Saccharibacteria bacterium SW_7_54_9]
MEQSSRQHSAAEAEGPDVSIVVPAYEEAASLPELVDGIRSACTEAD